MILFFGPSAFKKKTQIATLVETESASVWAPSLPSPSWPPKHQCLGFNSMMPPWWCLEYDTCWWCLMMFWFCLMMFWCFVLVFNELWFCWMVCVGVWWLCVFCTQDLSRQRSVVYCLDKSKLEHYNISNSLQFASSIITSNKDMQKTMALCENENNYIQLEDMHVVHMSCV